MSRAHVVGFSGGIDSQACALWVRREFPGETIYLVNSDAGGNEHPITTAFLAAYSAAVHPVVMLTPRLSDMPGVGSVNGARAALGKGEHDPMTFGDLAALKGRFPSSQAQFCTTWLKLAPTRRWHAETFDGTDCEVVRYAGVRADESRARAKLPATEWDDYFDCELRRPILAWTKQECFDAVTDAGEEFNALYKLGFSRVGCAPCVNAGKDDVRRWAAAFPEMIDKVREWEAQAGRTFFPPITAGRINWIDEVVTWSKTTRGGRQFELPIIEAVAASGGCNSNYGICE